MTFTEIIKQDLGKKYFFYFKGRASRSEFWLFMLFIFLVNLFVGILSSFLPIIVGQSLSIIVSLLLFPANLGVTVRRLHDRNLKGWWLLLPITPFLFWMLMGGFNSPPNMALSILSLVLSLCYLIILCLPGTNGPNNFGDKP